MSKVCGSVEKNRARMPTSMKALPMKVKITNFIAEYSLRPLPHIEMRKNMGTSSSSQKMKNIRKSRDVKTPITAVWSASSHTKYSRTRCFTLQEPNTATMPRSPVSSTIGALSPSTPRKYCTWNDSTGIQFSKRSTNCRPPSPRSYSANTTTDSAKSASTAAPASTRAQTTSRPNSAIITATARGRNTVRVNSP